MQHLETIREFVQRHAVGVGDDEDLFATGYVNSLFALQAVVFVEQTFDVSVTGDDLDIRNFRSISAIDHFVAAHDGRRVGA